MTCIVTLMTRALALGVSRCGVTFDGGGWVSVGSGDALMSASGHDGVGRVVAHDIEKQTRQVLANIRTVLEDAGSSWERIVDVTVYLTDMAGDFATFNRIYAEHFPTHQPTRTTVEVGALPTAIAIELKVVAEG